MRHAGHAPLRVVCYAVNGTGVGHLTRLLAIARWLRRYAAALGERLEVWFLTSSEATGLAFAEGFAAFKIPSKTIVGEAGIDRAAYTALAKQWVWHTLGLLRPDVLVVDTFPRGSFGELLGALDLARTAAFVHRPVRREVAARPDFQAMMRLYDLVLVPETEGPVHVPAEAHDRLVFTGPVLLRERWELVPRAEARRQLGIGDRERCVYVSAGGGGDARAAAQLEAAVHALAGVPSMRVVVGAGPLYRGPPFPRVTVVTRAAEWALAFDLAVCAAGYNTFAELMFAGVPALFVPQDKLADDQAARAARAVAVGAASVHAPDADLAAEAAAMLGRPEARSAARSLVPENGARVAAAEILRLVLPAARVDHVEAALDDERLARVWASGAEPLVLDLAAVLARGRAPELGAAIDECERISRAVVGEPRELRGVLEAIARGLPESSAATRADAWGAALATLGELRPGDGPLARAAVATGAWGAAAGLVEGARLAAAMRASVEHHPVDPTEPRG